MHGESKREKERRESEEIGSKREKGNVGQKRPSKGGVQKGLSDVLRGGKTIYPSKRRKLLKDYT